VLREICQGRTREQISESEGITLNVVKAIVDNVLEKLGADNDISAARIATEAHLL
jgi:DNA-binding NarL/FixJ family response regulator